MRRIVALTLLLLPSILIAEPMITTLAGTGEKGFAGDGAKAVDAKLNGPFALAFDPMGNLYFSDTGNHTIRRVDAKTGIISTFAGIGKKGFSGDGGPATKAMLNEPYGIVFDKEGKLYIVDRLNYVIRRVDAAGVIDTIAGIPGKSGFSGDGGPAKKAGLKEPNGIALDGKVRLYIADVADQRVRVLDLSKGTIETFCGNGKKAQTGDGGPFREASLFGPRAVAIDPDGNVVICEREGNALRRVNLKSGMIERLAGTGKKGYTGDGGLAKDATFNGPKELDIDREGNIFVVDTESDVIRRIDAKTGKISTVVGTGQRGNKGNGGPAVKAQLGRPHGVIIGSEGAIYIGDTLSNQVRMVK